MTAFRIGCITLSLIIAWIAGFGFSAGADQGVVLIALGLGLLSLAGRG